jgi:hypothetical protein
MSFKIILEAFTKKTEAAKPTKRTMKAKQGF